MVKTIKFKSSPNNWQKECFGLKQNIVRELKDKEDIRHELLNEFLMRDINLLQVQIENTQTREVFTRTVSDVTEFKDDVFIISWRHKDE